MASKRQLGEDANQSSLHAKEPKLELKHTENATFFQILDIE